ncbi:MAG TPA: HNH endonuclease [Candidatus Tumulicola sp.]|jgi:hypothetical protein
MLCIFCIQERPARSGAGEHPIPLSVGGSWAIDRVCEKCDNEFGYTHDALLTRVTSVAARRAQLGLAGNSGRVPVNPSEVLPRHPVSVVDAPYHKMILRRDVAGKIKARSIPNIEFDISDGDGEGVLVAIRPETFVIDVIPEIEAVELITRRLTRALEERGFQFNNEIIEAAAEKLFSQVSVFERPITVRVERKTVNRGFAASLFKAAYEAAWYWLGDDWLSDPEADRMRRHLRGDESILIRGAIQAGEIRPVRVAPATRSAAHVIYLVNAVACFTVELQLFDIFSIGVLVTNEPGRYTVRKFSAIIMDAVGGTFRELASNELF